MQTQYYFDYAAATPMDTEVFGAMQPYFIDNFYNPSADYEPARQAKQALDKARSDIANVLAVRPAEIVFTAGGTEANNLAISGIMQQHSAAEMVISAIEHDSVRMAAQKYNCVETPVQPNGIVSIEALVQNISERTVLVSVMLANNEIGTVQPLRKISQEIERIRRSRALEGSKLPLYLHTDAAQAANYLPLHAHRLGVDLMSVNGGKIYGPKQSGFLYVRGGVQLYPILVGGGQERGLRSGTENVAACVGLAKALEIAARKQPTETERLQNLQRKTYDLLEKSIPTATISGSKKHRLPNNIHITIPGIDNERILILLDERNIYAAAGSACSASSDEPSHVLAAIGLDGQAIRSSLRFTMGRDTSEASVEHLVATLAGLLAKS